MKKYIIVIDQGTTSSKILLIDELTRVVDKDSIEVKRITNTNKEILQNPKEILLSVTELIDRLFKRNNLDPKNVLALGITNQRETTVIWDKTTNEVISEAISWQSRHTSYITDVWINKGYNELVFKKTGLLINPYFSASKIKHLLMENHELNTNNLMFGTIDSYLIYNLTVEKNHYTDITNASRTMLFNINTKEYDEELLELFNIPKNILPEVLSNDSLFGHFKYQDTLIPIMGVAGDQQSALFGHLCLDKGDSKVTYGTGCFILTNTNSKPYFSNNGLLTTIAWQRANETIYAMEGSVFMGGSAVDWMKEKLDLFNNVYETEKMAYESKNDNVYVVPAFVGLGAPYWDNEIKGSILGLEASTTKTDILKATLNSIAYQVADVLNLMIEESNIKINSIAVDGGASNNNYLMQFQSDLVNLNLIQNIESEITGLGVGYIAGLSVGLWKSVEELKNLQKIKKIFIPTSKRISVTNQYKKWKIAVKATQVFKEGVK